MENMKHSNFKIGNAVIRKWNNRLYYICHDVDNDKWEFLISPVKGQKVSKCDVCEYFGNMRLATTDEINVGYAKEF